MVKLSFGLTKSTFGVVKECQIDLLRHTVHGHVGCSLAVVPWRKQEWLKQEWLL